METYHERADSFYLEQSFFCVLIRAAPRMFGGPARKLSVPRGGNVPSFRFVLGPSRPDPRHTLTHVPSSWPRRLVHIYCRTVRSLVTFLEEDSTAGLFFEVRFLPMALCSPRDTGKSATATKLRTRNRIATKGWRASVDDEQSPCAPCGHPNPQDASRGRGCIIIVDVQEERAWFIFRPR